MRSCPKCHGEVLLDGKAPPRIDGPNPKDAEIAALKAEVERLTRERDEAVASMKALDQLLAEREQDEPHKGHSGANFVAELWKKSRRMEVATTAATARVAVLEGLVKEADEAINWARGSGRADTMILEAWPWQVRARAALALPRDEDESAWHPAKGEDYRAKVALVTPQNEPCRFCGGERYDYGDGERCAGCNGTGTLATPQTEEGEP